MDRIDCDFNFLHLPTTQLLAELNRSFKQRQDAMKSQASRSRYGWISDLKFTEEMKNERQLKVYKDDTQETLSGKIQRAEEQMKEIRDHCDNGLMPGMQLMHWKTMMYWFTPRLLLMRTHRRLYFKMQKQMKKSAELLGRSTEMVIDLHNDIKAMKAAHTEIGA